MKQTITNPDPELKVYLKYYPHSGNFFWKKSIISPVLRKIGDKAGIDRGDGYIGISFKGIMYNAHQLAWWFYYKKWPDIMLNHKNCVKSDNRIKNLELVTHRQNLQLKKRHLNGKLVGASFIKKTEKWIASIRINNKKNYLGTFSTEFEAHTAYLNKCKEIGLDVKFPKISK